MAQLLAFQSLLSQKFLPFYILFLHIEFCSKSNRKRVFLAIWHTIIYTVQTNLFLMAMAAKLQTLNRGDLVSEV